MFECAITVCHEELSGRQTACLNVPSLSVMKSFLVGRCCMFECAITVCHEELSGRQVLHV